MLRAGAGSVPGMGWPGARTRGHRAWLTAASAARKQRRLRLPASASCGKIDTTCRAAEPGRFHWVRAWSGVLRIGLLSGLLSARLRS